MSYITRDQLRSVVNPTGTDPQYTPASLSDAQLDEIILWQEALIDARLSVRYSVPVSPVPDILQWLSLAFCSYHAWLTHRNTVDLEERDPAQLRYDSARNLLDALVAGEATLPGVSTTDADSGVSEPYNRFDEPVFTKEMFHLPDPSTAEAAERRNTRRFEGWPHGW